ncbi:TFIIB-type zinc finger domain-containing protein [Propionibacterium australiense]|uniref:Uncharacterized protein n=1 Tax=Propionibacterium australiense TaxID=119981 RepID=A0A383SAQ5_9ACTN|nr:TFIIB-type zinc finger domain-containing protein [Propionibacterium australiense]RLP06615.1 hypothetical protein D9T14_11915 [Propionibacterium australiense]SYZ34439.1 Hypothetical protein PROPAUS_2451 [Propionibacterium australiense]VEH89891.1 Uncharacterised protein [Propionibacterium australiense]
MNTYEIAFDPEPDTQTTLLREFLLPCRQRGGRHAHLDLPATILREAETVAQAVEGAERDFPQLVIVSARQIVPFPNPSWDELRMVLDEAFGDEPALTTNVRDVVHVIGALEAYYAPGMMTYQIVEDEDSVVSRYSPWVALEIEDPLRGLYRGDTLFRVGDLLPDPHVQASDSEGSLDPKDVCRDLDTFVAQQVVRTLRALVGADARQLHAERHAWNGFIDWQARRGNPECHQCGLPTVRRDEAWYCDSCGVQPTLDAIIQTLRDDYDCTVTYTARSHHAPARLHVTPPGNGAPDEMLTNLQRVIGRRMVLPATADTAAPITAGPITIGDETFVITVGDDARPSTT